MTEQFADARDTAWQKRWDERVPLIGPLFADEHAGFIAGFDAAVALLSQPSLSAPRGDHDDWQCARCGGSPREHSVPDSTCVWEPVSNIA
jgi:hypothetical protein